MRRRRLAVPTVAVVLGLAALGAPTATAAPVLLLGPGHRVVPASYRGYSSSFSATPPALALLTAHARVRRPIAIRFRLSKFSHVGIVVVHGGQTVFLTSGYFGYGAQAFSVPPLSGKGAYAIRLAATDLAGNLIASWGRSSSAELAAQAHARPRCVAREPIAVA